MKNSLTGGQEGRLSVVVASGIVVAVEVGKVAARDIDADAVTGLEEVAGRVHLDGVFVDAVRLNLVIDASKEIEKELL